MTISGQPVVLFWNVYFAAGRDMVTQLEYDKTLPTCPVKNCFLTSDRRYLNQSTAVIFHAWNLASYDLPPFRHQHQLYVFFSLEPPHNTPDLREKRWSNFFNLTWTYRRDSDIFSRIYYHDYRPSLWSDRKEGEKTLRQKKDRALAMISNRHPPSNRDVYIQELQRFFPVDVIGSCGAKACPACTDPARDYKFYLAFENSLCRDYITEKAMRPFTSESLPILIGSHNYSRIFPPGSYIAGANYTPKMMAAKLRGLIDNFTEYQTFFEWKYHEKYLSIHDEFDSDRSDICKLCEMINLTEPNRVHKIYDHIHEWWVTEAFCFTPLYGSVF